MQLDGAVITEQGVTFAVVVVRESVLSSETQSKEAIVAFSRVFKGSPTILMAQNAQGVARYYGRPDLVRFMANVPLHAVPWRKYTVS